MRPPSRSRIRHYTRRQRKKHFVGEFGHWGAELRVIFVRLVQWDAVIDDFLGTITTCGLHAAGFGRQESGLYIEGAVVRMGSRDDAEAAIKAAADRLRGHPLIAAVQTAALFDLCWGLVSEDDDLPPFSSSTAAGEAHAIATTTGEVSQC
jgi:uncharacterized protein YggL (DUF469 family)